MDIKPIIFTKEECAIRHFNSLYRFFKETWGKTFSELGSNKNSLSGDFSRLDMLTGLFHEFRAVGFHGYQFFDLNKQVDAEHPYFSQIDGPVVEALKQRGIFRVASLEYLCIAPEFRKSSNGISFGEVLIGFSVNYLKNFDLDGIIGITRNNRSVNKSAHNNGAESIITNLDLHGVKVDVVLFRPDQIKSNPNILVQEQIDSLLNKVSDDQYQARSAA